MRLPAELEQLRLRGYRELAARRREGSRLYEPLPNGLAFHKCPAPERIIIGGNRGGKAQPINEPVLTPDGWMEIGKIKVGDVILGGDGSPCLVTGVFPQGVKPVFRVTFSDGSWTRCCEEHLWKVKTRADRFRGKTDSWSVLSLGKIRQKWGDRPKAIQRVVVPECSVWMPRRRTLVDPYLMGLIIGDGCLSKNHSVSFSTSDEELLVAANAAVDEDGKMEMVKSSKRHHGKVAYDYHFRCIRGKKKKNVIKDAFDIYGLIGKRSWEKSVPADYLFNSREVRLAVLQGLMDTDGTVGKPTRGVKDGWTVSFCTTSPALADNVAYLVRSLGGKCSPGRWREKTYTYKGEAKKGRPCVNLQIRMVDDCPFRLERKAELWKEWRQTAIKMPAKVLREIDADGEHECVCISVSSPDHTYITRGMIVTHNTRCAATELAWAVTNTHPYLNYPKTGVAVVVAQKESALANPIWSILRKSGGAFKVIKDERTKQWRSVRPWEEYDQANKEKWRGNEPLIPSRLIEGRPSYYSKNKEVPEYVRLKTGWEIYFFSDNSEPQKGTSYDLVWFNEEIGRWYAEASARLIDRGGKFIWDATPEAGTDELFNLWVRSQKPMPEGASRPVECFELHMLENPHVSQKEKETFIEKFKTNPVIYQTKVLGKFALKESLCYPEFQPDGIHGIDPFPIPWDWTRYVTIDPGIDTTAVLYFAVPPPDHNQQQLHVYDELYLHRCDAAMLAREMREKAGGNWIRAAILDMRMGRQTQMSGQTVAQQIEDALKEEKVFFEEPGFRAGSDDIKARMGRVRHHLGLHRDGYPRLVVHRNVRWLLWEMEKYRLDKDKFGILMDRPVAKDNHAANCLEYGCAADLRWVPPPGKGGMGKGISRVDLMKRQREWWGCGSSERAGFSLGGSYN